MKRNPAQTESEGIDTAMDEECLLTLSRHFYSNVIYKNISKST